MIVTSWFLPESQLKIGCSSDFQSTFRLCFWLRRSHSTILVTKISHVRIGWKIAKFFKRESNERRNTLASLRHVTTVNLFYLACMIFGGKWFLTRLAWIWFSTFLNTFLSTMYYVYSTCIKTCNPEKLYSLYRKKTGVQTCQACLTGQ